MSCPTVNAEPFAAEIVVMPVLATPGRLCAWAQEHVYIRVFWFALFGRDLHLYDCRACQEHLWPLPVACHAVFLFPAAVYQVSLALARRAFRPVPNRRELP